MCLYLNLKETNKLKKKWKDNRHTVKIVKEVLVKKIKNDFLIITPCKYTPIVLDKYGYFHSNRETKEISNNERANSEVHYGIHCYKNMRKIYLNTLAICNISVFSLYIKVEARKKDFVATDAYNEMVFTKIKFPKETIQLLKKHGIKVARK